jgi:hypothetical protein
MELNIRKRGDRFVLVGTYHGFVFESKPDWETLGEARDQRWLLIDRAEKEQERSDLWANWKLPEGTK